MELSNEIIGKLDPCYDPTSVGIPDGEELSVTVWDAKYRNAVKSEADIIWLLCRNEFMSDKDLRLFAVWCAREALKHAKNPDPRSIEACNVAERYANGDATIQELSAAMSAAMSAIYAGLAAIYAAMSAVESAAIYAAIYAARSAEYATRSAEYATMSAQVDKLLTFFKK